MTGRPREVFLSHSIRDRKVASQVAAELRRHDIPVWFSPHNIRGGREWIEEIGVALRRCDWFIVLLTRSAVASRWVKREVEYAFNDVRYNDRIIPLLVEECDFDDLCWVLRTVQMLQFPKASAETIRQLLKLWGIGYRKP